MRLNGLVVGDTRLAARLTADHQPDDTDGPSSNTLRRMLRRR